LQFNNKVNSLLIASPLISRNKRRLYNLALKAEDTLAALVLKTPLKLDAAAERQMESSTSSMCVHSRAFLSLIVLRISQGIAYGTTIYSLVYCPLLWITGKQGRSA
jgi:hypothetical protein